MESPYQHKFGTPKQATIAREDGGLQEGIHLFAHLLVLLDLTRSFKEYYTSNLNLLNVYNH